MVFNPSLEEHAAASAVAALSGKRRRDGADDAAGGFHVYKVARADSPVIMHVAAMPSPAVPHMQMPAVMAGPPAPPDDSAASQSESITIKSVHKLQAAPFFYYRDYSRELDPDHLTPLTPPGRVPNFPAKMHAILSRPDLADVIAWMPHGRSWRVLKPREFEVRVLPTFFEHSKFSSFIRQANGWGFRRITQGRDRNSYYHELFLRALPHLCKQMKRPGVAEKRPADSEHEPDFYSIAEAFPVPEKADDESILLECTVQGGPKARMPIYTGASLSAESLRFIQGGSDMAVHSNSGTTLTPKDQSSLFSFHSAISASANQICMHMPQEKTLSPFFNPQNSCMNTPVVFAPTMAYNDSNVESQSSSSNNFSFTVPTLPMFTFQAPSAAPAVATSDIKNFNFQSSSAASQFAAGFAAATALSSNHIRNVLGQALAANQNFQQFQQVPAPVVNQPGEQQF